MLLRRLCFRSVITFGIALAFAVSLFSSRSQLRKVSKNRQLVDLRTESRDAPWDMSTGGLMSKKRTYPKEGVEVGFLSSLPTDYFHELQRIVDEDDNHKRCARYGFSYNETYGSSGDIESRKKRRIFFGALVASEPWELFEIAGAETYGIFDGIVFVESNRTQNFTPRNVTHLDDAELFSDIFGVENVQVRMYADERPGLKDLGREHQQRAEILRGWKDLGMRPEDVGLLSDADETLTRDFLRAIQVCDIDLLDYSRHHCNRKGHGIRASTLVFETSPDCVTNGRTWFHPSVLVGACIEEIGDETFHPKAPRKKNSFLRGEGYGLDGNWSLEEKITDNRYPLWSAADFRRVGGAQQIKVEKQDSLFGKYTAFHFHNFFTNQNDFRFKYRTYGHPSKMAYKQALSDLSKDTNLMVRCAKKMPDEEDKLNPVEYGFEGIPRFRPIYFHDPVYRRHRRDFIRELVLADEEMFPDKEQLEA